MELEHLGFYSPEDYGVKKMLEPDEFGRALLNSIDKADTETTAWEDVKAEIEQEQKYSGKISLRVPK